MRSNTIKYVVQMKKNTGAPPSHFMDLLLDAVCAVDPQGRFVFVSAACERIFGYTPQEMIGRVMIDMVHPDDRARTQIAAAEIMAGQAVTHFENRYVRKDGRIVHIMWSARWSETDQLRIAVARDITERKHVESMQAALYAISEAAHATKDLLALLREVHQIIGELLPADDFLVALYDEKSGELSFPYQADGDHQPPAPRKLDSDTLIGEIIRTEQMLLISPETISTLPESARTTVNKNTLYWLGAPLSSHKGVIGALVMQRYAKGACYTDADKELLQFVSTQIAAAIERKRMYARLEHLAQYDQLTGLPNRELLQDRLRTALARARREHEELCLLYLDMDKFKQVNDSLGHAAGDRLLQMVAQRLKECVRESDTVARIGGDEFVILFERIHSRENSLMMAEKIRVALNRSFDMDQQNLHILPSIGVAFYPEHGTDEKQLFNHADEAMYLAKHVGGNRIEIKVATAR